MLDIKFHPLFLFADFFVEFDSRNIPPDDKTLRAANTLVQLLNSQGFKAQLALPRQKLSPNTLQVIVAPNPKKYLPQINPSGE